MDDRSNASQDGVNQQAYSNNGKPNWRAMGERRTRLDLYYIILTNVRGKTVNTLRDSDAHQNAQGSSMGHAISVQQVP